MSEITAGMRADEILSARLRALYGQYGYRIYKVNRFEAYELYVQNKNFLTDERVLTFTDLNGRLMALKPDITLSVVRNTRDEREPVRVCYSESAYRVPRGGDRFQEIMQTGIEYIGNCEPAALAEILLLAQKSLRIISDRYALDISHMGLVQELLRFARIEEADYPEVLEMIRRKDRHGMQDFTARQALPGQSCDLLDLMIILSGPVIPALERLSAFPLPESTLQIMRELEQIARLSQRVWSGTLNLDFSVLGDMQYYNGLTLSGFIDGIPSPVLIGGQYDPLLSRLGRQGQGIGFAVYLNQIDRCMPEMPEKAIQFVPPGSDPEAAFLEAERLRADGKTVILGEEETDKC